MRQIRFRAWDKLTNQMVGDGFHLFGEFMMFRLMETYVIENPVEHNQNSGLEYELWRYENIEVMQFTGCQINGVDLYEGDIIKGPNGKLWIIEWRQYGWWVNNSLIESIGWAKLAGDEKYTLSSWLKMGPARDIEKIVILGSVHTHPHLLTTNTQDK